METEEADNFIKVPKWIDDDKDLSPVAYRMLITICSETEKKEWLTGTEKWLAERCNVSESTVKRTLVWLAKKGYVKLKHKSKNIQVKIMIGQNDLSSTPVIGQNDLSLQARKEEVCYVKLTYHNIPPKNPYNKNTDTNTDSDTNTDTEKTKKKGARQVLPETTRPAPTKPSAARLPSPNPSTDTEKAENAEDKARKRHEEHFIRFMALYPKRRALGTKDARNAWDRIKDIDSEYPLIMSYITHMLGDGWSDEDGRYAPDMGKFLARKPWKSDANGWDGKIFDRFLREDDKMTKEQQDALLKELDI